MGQIGYRLGYPPVRGRGSIPLWSTTLYSSAAVAKSADATDLDSVGSPSYH